MLIILLEMMVRKIIHEKPGKEMSQESQNDNELESILTEADQATEDLKQTDHEEFVDDTNVRQDNKNLTYEQLLYFSEKISPDWPKLAVKLGRLYICFIKFIISPNLIMHSYKLIFKHWHFINFILGYKPDEIDFFKNENPTPIEQARNLLQIWFEDDEDASLDNLLYILEGLEMNEAAEAVRSEISNNMETFLIQ